MFTLKLLKRINIIFYTQTWLAAIIIYPIYPTPPETDLINCKSTPYEI